MRYRLRTLMIVLAVVPPILGWMIRTAAPAWWPGVVPNYWLIALFCGTMVFMYLVLPDFKFTQGLEKRDDK